MEDCLFCKIVAGEIPSTCVYQDDWCYAFRDINPQAPTHILVVPKKHIDSAADIDESNSEIVAKMFEAAAKIARQEGLTENGYRLVSNIGEWGQQSVKHLHIHILGGRKFTWPPG